MSEMIDKVETAIFEAVGYSIPLEMCREAAIAAMNAMREPTDTMLDSGEWAGGENGVGRSSAYVVWSEMIAAALK